MFDQVPRLDCCLIREFYHSPRLLFDQVPRLLFEDVQLLESYVMKSSDPAIRRWWAQYMESTGNSIDTYVWPDRSFGGSVFIFTGMY
jgi:hypothetical protein